MSGFITAEFNDTVKCTNCWASNNIVEKDICLTQEFNYGGFYESYYICHECQKEQKISIPPVVLKRIESQTGNFLVKNDCCRILVRTDNLKFKYVQPDCFSGGFYAPQVVCPKCSKLKTLRSSNVPNSIYQKMKAELNN